MQIRRGIIWLPESYTTCGPRIYGYTDFTDAKGNEYAIPNELVVRLYELIKFEVEYRGYNFEEWTKETLEGTK